MQKNSSGYQEHGLQTVDNSVYDFVTEVSLMSVIFDCLNHCKPGQ